VKEAMNRILVPREVKSRASDATLLQCFRANRDDASFAELVARHGAMVYGVCLRILGRCQDAEDAFQVVFLQLARNADRLSDGDLGGWLHTAARRVSLTSIRDRRRCRWTVWKKEPGIAVKATEEVDVDLDAALATLSEQERTAIILCHLEGLSRSEAAKALECPEGTLNARLSRGLEKLRRRFGRPPLATLVAASLVMLPDALRASTVDLVHHCRGGTLDDWASPRIVELFRRAKPMNVLHRAGPIAAALVAVAFIMTGGAVGWELISAQPPRDPETLPRPTNSDDLVKAYREAQQLAKQAPRVGDVGGMTLFDAVKDFNERAKKDSIGMNQQPLTEEELVAAIRSRQRDSASGRDSKAFPPASDALFDVFYRIPDDRRLPAGTTLDSINQLWSNGCEIDVWWIDLRIPDRSKSPAPGIHVRVRDQRIRSRVMTAEEIASRRSHMEEVAWSVKYSSAADVAEMVNNAMRGKWPNCEVRVVAGKNTLVISAPHAQQQAIIKMIQALDEMKKPVASGLGR
jgi:RNA polymerase sigma factor (sigma-70 family)